MRRTLSASFLFVLLATPFASVAQADEDLEVRGNVLSEEGGNVLAGAHIEVLLDGVRAVMLVTDTAGWYSVRVPLERYVELHYSTAGRVTKFIRIDTHNVPMHARAGGFGMTVDVRLFREEPGKNYAFMKEPIGKAAWSMNDTLFTWDLEWTAKQRVRIDAVRSAPTP